MKKIAPLVLFAVCLAPVHAEDIETLRSGLDEALSSAAGDARAAFVDRDGPLPEDLPVPPSGEVRPYPMPEPEKREPFLQKPELIGMESFEVLGGLLGSFTLAERLDAHSDLFTLTLGDKDYDISLASDSAFDRQYFAFRREGRVLLSEVEDVNRLRKEGVIVKLDDKTSYKFKVSVNIFSPTRGSTLNITPERGTRGPRHKIKTGRILDAVERESFVFRAEGKEYWLLYGTDVDPAAGRLGGTRSLLFIHEDGLSSKAWPVAEAKLTTGKPLSVSLGGTRIALVKTLAGRLRIHSARKAASAGAAR